MVKKSFFEQKNIAVIAQIILIMLFIPLIVTRIRHGVDLTDEMWYIAEPWRVATGDLIPFVNNYTQATGFSLPLAIVYWLYARINEGPEGVVLFARAFYAIWSIVIWTMAFCLLRKKVPIFAVPMFFLTANGIYTMNYNTIGMVYTPLVFALLFSSENNERKLQIIKGFLAGMILVRVCIGSPQVIIWGAVLLALILFCYWRRMDEIKYPLFGVICGGLLFAVILLIYLVLNGGGPISALKAQLSVPYLKIERIYDPWIAIRTTAFELAPMLFLALLFFIINMIITKRKISLGVDHVSIFLCAYFCISLIRFRHGNGPILQHIWSLALLNAIFNKKVNDRKIIVIASVAYYFGYLFATYTNIFGYGADRSYWLAVPALLFVYSIYGIFEKNIKYIAILMLIAMCFPVVWNSMNTYHRDVQYSEQTDMIDEGIWKGLITSHDRRVLAEETENKIKQLNIDDSKVLFLEGWVSYAYLMTEAKMASPSTLDVLMHEYGLNTDEYLIEYMENNGLPDSIVYILTGDNKYYSEKWDEYIGANYLLMESVDLDTTESVSLQVYDRK